MSDAESHWEQLKGKLIKTIELKEFFNVSGHVYEDSINNSRIPAINGEPRFILHSLPDSDNKEGYIPENMLSALLNKVMTQHWLFLLGTSG